jgi:signal transduction histidine kinase
VSDVLPFRSPAASIEPGVDVRELVLDLCTTLADQLAAQQIATEVDIPFGERLQADREMLRQALLQLIHRAMRVMPDGGELTFSSCSGTDWYDLEIADTGPGFSREARRRFGSLSMSRDAGTTDPLMTVARWLQTSGGSLRIENCPQGGAAVTLQISRRVREAAA